MAINIEKLKSKNSETKIFEYLLDYCNTQNKTSALKRIINIRINNNVLYLPVNTLNIFNDLKQIRDFLDNNFTLSQPNKICLSLYENFNLEIPCFDNVLNIETQKLNLLAFINYNLIKHYLYQNISKTISIKKLIKTLSSCLTLIYKQPIELHILDTEKQISDKETINKIMQYFRLTLSKSSINQKIIINGYRENKDYILEYVNNSKPFLSIRF